MRRSEREIKDRQVLLNILETAQVMHLGLCAAGQAYVVPLHYGWDEQEGKLFLYFHSAPEGKKIDYIRENPSCIVCITGNMQVKQADEACDSSAAFESLMIEGTVSILSDEADKAKGLDAILHHYDFQGKPVYKDSSLQNTSVCRILVTSISGKRRQ